MKKVFKKFKITVGGSKVRTKGPSQCGCLC